MQQAQPNLLTRDDTFFGVCEGIGEDFGFNSNWLRLALAGLLFWNPLAAAVAYAAAAALVLLSRLLVPDPRRPAAVAQEPLPALDEAEQGALPLAA